MTDALEWKDITSYRRGDTERVPRSWRLDVGLFSAIVTRDIDLPGEWVVRYHFHSIDTNLEDDGDLDGIKSFAAALLVAHAESAAKSIRESGLIRENDADVVEQ